MALNFYLTFAKTIEQAKSKIGYMLGGRSSSEIDRTRNIEWESWNFGAINEGRQIREISDIYSAWEECILKKRRERIYSPQKGRPGVKTAIMMSINEDAHLDYFQYIRKGIWNWVMQDFNDYMGLIAYHIENNGFHTHVIVNPVPVMSVNAEQGECKTLRISKRDIYPRNHYVRHRDAAIMEGLRKAASEMGYKNDSVIIPIAGADFNIYREIIRKSRIASMEMLRSKAMSATKIGGRIDGARRIQI